MAADDNRPGGPEPYDVYRHHDPRRGLFTVVARSVKEDTREQLVTYRGCKDGTCWTRTLMNFLEVIDTPAGRAPRFTRVEG